VTVNDDNKVELDEVFNVMISNLAASGREVTFTKENGTGTIENDDMAYVHIDSVAMDEGNFPDLTSFIFTVRLEGEVDAAVMVDYKTEDGAATLSDNDYQSNTGMLNFPAMGGVSQTQNITVMVIGDDVSEPDETFFVILSNLVASGRDVQFAVDTGLGTILDDDCMLPDIPGLTQDTVICPKDMAMIRVLNGELNQATEWVLYTGSCGGMEVTRNDSGVFFVQPMEITEYFVRGEGGCVVLDATCSSVTVTPAAFADISFDVAVCCPYTIAVFVDMNASGNNDGTDWNNAFHDLGDAFLATSVCSGLADEIWVAEGVYYPDRILGLETGDRNASFILRNGIRILGGFPSGGNPGLADRNPSTFQSILCGDIGNPNDKSDNSFHVVTGINLSDQTLMDGFIIRNGMADGDNDEAHGAGIFTSSEGVDGVNQPVFKNIVFNNNMASGNGGAMYSLANSTGSPLVENSSFIGNIAMMNGGGFYSAALSENAAALPNFRNVSFLNNVAGGDGGGLHSEAIGVGSLASILMVNTLMAKNTATRGGAISQMSTGDNAVANMKIVNNTMADNEADVEGGAIFHFSSSTASSSSLDIINNIIYNNMASMGATLYQEGNNSSTEISYSIIHAADCNDMVSLAMIGGNIMCDDLSILFNVNPGFIDPDNNNYRLHNGSIGINQGNNAEPEIYDPDLDGNTRVFGPVIDLGAYETQVLMRVIPTMSEWGLSILILLFVIVGRLKMKHFYYEVQ
ncbi:MAG TPA: Calx-beta domain-containing protein, partial [Saprospiraceae bacterium]|nr:Calx-beta domain-containing protein [Saprospiraceae bacterium]